MAAGLRIGDALLVGVTLLRLIAGATSAGGVTAGGVRVSGVVVGLLVLLNIVSCL